MQMNLIQVDGPYSESIRQKIIQNLNKNGCGLTEEQEGKVREAVREVLETISKESGMKMIMSDRTFDPCATYKGSD